MKNSLIRYAAILFGIFVILSVMDMRGNYVAEQIIWRTNREFATVIQNPETTPDAVYEKLLSRYRRVVQKLPHSPLAPRSHIMMAKVEAARGRYDDARKTLNEIFAIYPGNDLVLAETTAEIAKTHELQNDWKSAHALYKKIIADYPLTDIGLMAPVYIANYYNTTNDTQAAARAYDDAIRHYSGIIEQNQNSLIEFKALRLLSNCYLARQQWRNALETMGRIIITYPEPRNTFMTTNAINTVVSAHRVYIDTAIGIYRQFLETHAAHPINPLINEMIVKLQELKNQRIDAAPGTDGKT